MKKIISMLLAGAMFCSMALTATAADKAADLPVKNYTYERYEIKNTNEQQETYIDVQKSSGGYVVVYREDGKWWYTHNDNGTGKVCQVWNDAIGGLIEGFDYAAPFKDGMAIAGIIDGDKLQLGFVTTGFQFIPFRNKDGSYFSAPKQLYLGKDDAGGINNRMINAYEYNEGFVCLPISEGKYVAFDDEGEFVADGFEVGGEKYHMGAAYSNGFFQGRADDGKISFFAPVYVEADDGKGEKYNKLEKFEERIAFGNSYVSGAVKWRITDVYYGLKNNYVCVRLKDDEGNGGFVLALCDEHEPKYGDVKVCKAVWVRYFVGSAGKKAINDGVIVYTDNNDKYHIYDVENVKIEDEAFSDLTLPVKGVMIGSVKGEGDYQILNTSGESFIDDCFDSGDIFEDGTIVMKKGNERLFYELDGEGNLCNMKVSGIDLPKDYRGDAGIDGDDKYIYVDIEGKYGFGKLTPAPEEEAPGSADIESGEQQPEDANPPTQKEKDFSDVPSSAWYYSDLKSAYDAGLINGKTATEFKPNDNMTYAEAVKLAACLHQLVAEGKVTLANAPAGQPWYQTYVDYCRAKGIVDRNYDYTAPATRAGYMMIFANALPDEKLPAINAVPDGSIPDIDMSKDGMDKMAPSIYKLYRAGIVAGRDTAHNCKPYENIKRSEVATILARMMFPEKRIEFTLGTPPQGEQGDTETTDGAENVGGSTDSVETGSKEDEAIQTEVEFKITKEPTTSTIEKGGKAFLDVKVEGGKEPYTYQWQFKTIQSWMDCSDNSNMQGSKTNELTVQAEDSGTTEFRCVITDANKKELVSQVVEVTVN